MADALDAADLCEPQAARILGVSARTLRRYRQAGRITHLAMPGGRIAYSLADLIAFRQACRVIGPNVA